MIAFSVASFVSPEIIRVGVVPSEKLYLASSAVSVKAANLKRFDYVILGDAGTLVGLGAPYEEDETMQIAQLQKLTAGTDFFDYWLSNQNTDQVTNRIVEPRKLNPS